MNKEKSMKYFNTEYYSSLSHAENSKKRDLGGTSITSEKGTDGKANKEKWKDNTNTTKEISESAGLNEDDVKKLKELAKSTDKKTTTKKTTPSKDEKAYKEKSEYYTGHYGGSVKHFDNSGHKYFS